MRDLRQHERDGLIWAASAAGWGAWVALLLDPGISATYDALESAASLRLQGVAIALLAGAATGMWWRGRWLRLASALTVAPWVWIWGGMMLGQWRSTATWMYGVSSVWAAWVYWRAWRTAGDGDVG